jgi:hypothetical protein
MTAAAGAKEANSMVTVNITESQQICRIFLHLLGRVTVSYMRWYRQEQRVSKRQVEPSGNFTYHQV